MLSDLVVKYGYLMVVAGVIVEGDATVVTAAFLAHRGYLKLGAVIALAAITSMTMNQIYFRLGRRHVIDAVAAAQPEVNLVHRHARDRREGNHRAKLQVAAMRQECCGHYRRIAFNDDAGHDHQVAVLDDQI